MSDTLSNTIAIPDGWTSVASPPALFRRYEFGSYRETRAFLDRLATLSKETRIFPDLGFGKTYVNVTLRAADGGEPSGAELRYAERAAAPDLALAS